MIVAFCNCHRLREVHKQSKGIFFPGCYAFEIVFTV